MLDKLLRRNLSLTACLAVLASLTGPVLMEARAAEPLVVGSKRFTESFILGEILRQTAESKDSKAVHRQGLGNTAIVFAALQAGEIDLYPDYSGTIAREILKLDRVPPLPELNRLLAPLGVAVAVPLGFNNTYALGMRGSEAKMRGIKRISDLALHPDLKAGFTHEFIGRGDGWKGLAVAYGLKAHTVRGLDHGLAYAALAAGEIDLMDVYATDAQIAHHDLALLVDDRSFFPRYDAILLHRLDLPMRHPAAWLRIAKLEGAIDEVAMRRLNAEAEAGSQGASRPVAEVAARWLAARGTTAVPGQSAGPASARTSFGASFWQALTGPDLARLALEHAGLVLASLAVSIGLGVPLGIFAFRVRRARAAVLGVVGMIQTIPSLALLAMLIPLTGTIGAVPALIALALYGLLPIVSGTEVGLREVPTNLRLAGQSLGLVPADILRSIELPLAYPVILAGIKTSAVINVGTATIAAFIGAGGFGERIVSGLALHDHAMLLAGAVPAALLALGIEAAFLLAARQQGHSQANAS